MDDFSRDRGLSERASSGLPCGSRGVKGGSLGAKPSAGGRFRARSVLWAQLAQRLVEHGVALAGGFCHQVPFESLDLVDRGALAGDQYAREPVLGNRAVLLGGLAQQRQRGGFVLRRAGPIIKSDGVFDLGIDVVAECSRLQQSDRSFDVLGNAGALLVESRERVLRFRIASVGGHPKQLRRALDVLWQCLSVEI